MGFFKAILDLVRPPPAAPRVSREDLEQTFTAYDRKLAELNDAMHALRDHRPDRRIPPGNTHAS
jgi:hypothetical protein